MADINILVVNSIDIVSFLRGGGGGGERFHDIIRTCQILVFQLSSSGLHLHSSLKLVIVDILSHYLLVSVESLSLE